jgi:hypothetical protein
MGLNQKGTTAAALLMTLTITSCNTATGARNQRPPTPPPSPSVTSTHPSQTAVPNDASPIDGTWISHRTKQQIVTQIEDAGHGRWTRAFLVGQDIQDRYTAVYTFEDGRFSVAYFERGGIWHVGWKGDVQVRGHRVVMHDEYTQTTDVYRWTKRRNGLHFTRIPSSTDADAVSGIPSEVYDAAYLSDIWRPTTCVLKAGVDC